MNCVFILGAGASVHAGGPTMANFLDKMEDLYFSNLLKDDERVPIHETLKFIKNQRDIFSRAYVDLDNIEELFGYLEMYALLDESQTEQRTNLVRSIVSTLDHYVRLSYSNGKLTAPKGYDNLVKMTQELEAEDCRWQSDYITFNYDLGLDAALATNDVSFDYHIEKTDATCPSLLKLHGSLNWKICPGCQRVTVCNIEPFNQSGDSENDLPSSEACERHVACPAENCRRSLSGPVPLVVPPTWNKREYHNAIPNVWAKAREVLNNATHIFVIGYSLPVTDNFFRYLFANAASGTNRRLRAFCVLDPSAKELRTNFSDFLGRSVMKRFSYIPDYFDNNKAGVHIMRYVIKNQQHPKICYE